MSHLRWVLGVVFICMSALSWAAVADAKKADVTKKIVGPHEAVERVTADFLALLKKEGGKGKDMDVLYGKVEDLLEPVVSFDFIAKSVMHRFWKSAKPAQKKAFAETFKKGMVETLAKGMLNFADLKTRIVPAESDITGKRKVEVVQEVLSAKGTNSVAYTMAFSRKANQWKLINVVLNGVNLGKSFREQFEHAAKQHKGDLDAVITSWTAH